MVGGALTASSIIGMWGYQAAKQLLQEEVVRELADVGQIVETELANEMHNVSRQLSGFGASLLPLAERADGRADLTARLQTAMTVNERLLKLHIFDADGRLVASSSRVEHTEPVSKQAIGANLDGKGFVSAAIRSKTFDRQVLFVSEPLRAASGPVHGAIGPLRPAGRARRPGRRGDVQRERLRGDGRRRRPRHRAPGCRTAGQGRLELCRRSPGAQHRRHRIGGREERSR